MPMCTSFKLPLFFFLLHWAIHCPFFFFFFFLWHYFYFLINLGDHFFFFLGVVICYFFVLIKHHSLTMVYEQIFSNSFFLSFHLFTSNQTKKRENKIFSILLLFHHPTIFYPLTFSPFQPNGPLVPIQHPNTL